MRIVVKHISGSDAGRKDVFPFQRVIIGRDPDCDLTLNLHRDREVSGRHAELVPGDDGKLEVIDLESTNGTWLNEERVTRSALRSGDVIELGAGGPRLRIQFRRGLWNRLLGGKRKRS